jgi:hypothetical protein
MVVSIVSSTELAAVPSFIKSDMRGYDGIDILVRVSRGGIPQHRTAELGVSGLRDCQARTPLESVCNRSTGSLLGVSSPRDSYPLSCSDSQCCFAHGESGRRRRTRSYFFCTCFARCLLFDSHIGAHPVSSVGGHSNRQLVGARRHWGRSQCADNHICNSLERNHSEIGAMTVRIHVVNGIVLRLFSV